MEAGRSARIDQHGHIEARVFRAGKTAELAHHHVLVYDCKIGGLECSNDPVVLVGGGECHPHFSDVGAESQLRWSNRSLGEPGASHASKNRGADEGSENYGARGAEAEVPGHTENIGPSCRTLGLRPSSDVTLVHSSRCPWAVASRHAINGLISKTDWLLRMITPKAVLPSFPALLPNASSLRQSSVRLYPCPHSSGWSPGAFPSLPPRH